MKCGVEVVGVAVRESGSGTHKVCLFPCKEASSYFVLSQKRKRGRLKKVQ